MSTDQPPTPSAPREFPCKQCGAALVFAPGTTSLTCKYCGAVNEIALPTEEVQELDFLGELRKLEEGAEQEEVIAVKCSACGAESVFGPNQTAGACPFCGRPLVAVGETKKAIKPGALLPFRVDESRAVGQYRGWIASLWFAPSDLKIFAEQGGLKGVYTPAWTYDCGTVADYQGQRGDDYWDTETYSTMENGKMVTRTRQVRRTRWHRVSGRVDDTFDDVLVMASRSLPESCLAKLEPWDLKSAMPYRDEFLAGFVAESYQVDLRQGFEVAKSVMDGSIRQHICADIGGDHQRIDDMRVRYFDITYKHMLLPVWLSSYRYRDRLYRFLINARTGEVSGERPYSVWKISFLVLTILALIGIGLLIAQGSR